MIMYMFLFKFPFKFSICLNEIFYINSEFMNIHFMVGCSLIHGGIFKFSISCFFTSHHRMGPSYKLVYKP